MGLRDHVQEQQTRAANMSEEVARMASMAAHRIGSRPGPRHLSRLISHRHTFPMVGTHRESSVIRYS